MLHSGRLPRREHSCPCTEQSWPPWRHSAASLSLSPTPLPWPSCSSCLSDLGLCLWGCWSTSVFRSKAQLKCRKPWSLKGELKEGISPQLTPGLTGLLTTRIDTRWGRTPPPSESRLPEKEIFSPVSVSFTGLRDGPSTCARHIILVIHFVLHVVCSLTAATARLGDQLSQLK